MNEEIGIIEKKFKCEKCGTCCIDFAGQIRYKKSELRDGWQQLPLYYRKIILDFNSKMPKEYVFPLRISRIKRIRNQLSDIILIPTKLEFIAMIISMSFRNEKISVKDISRFSKHLEDFSETEKSKECLFLSSVEDNSNEKICSIHEYRPEMCENYPENKGYVCLNQTHRYFTKQFLHFKKETYDIELALLNRIFPYFARHNLEKTWDIMAFLIDFGKFEVEKVKTFFMEQGWKELDFKYALKDLRRFGLIFNSIGKSSKELVESISSSLLKKKLKQSN